MYIKLMLFTPKPYETLKLVKWYLVSDQIAYPENNLKAAKKKNESNTSTETRFYFIYRIPKIKKNF